MSTSREEWTFEEVAIGDIPAAFAFIQGATRKKQIDVVAHCMGAAMLSMAILDSDFRCCEVNDADENRVMRARAMPARPAFLESHWQRRAVAGRSAGCLCPGKHLSSLRREFHTARTSETEHSTFAPTTDSPHSSSIACSLRFLIQRVSFESRIPGPPGSGHPLSALGTGWMHGSDGY